MLSGEDFCEGGMVRLVWSLGSASVNCRLFSGSSDMVGCWSWQAVDAGEMEWWNGTQTVGNGEMG